ncbi:MAG: hypothetical protein WC788_04800 [Candidatus Paceibacterota bacterium]|jgi:hypothetical protein
MQETEIDIISTDEPGMVEKIKNWAYDNWQTILVVLIVLIVGMSAYNYNQNGTALEEKNSSAVAGKDDSSSNGNENTVVAENTDTADKNEGTEASAETKDQNNASAEDSSVLTNSTENVNTESNTVTSAIDDSGKKYTVTAVKGNGITHLARKALGEYLKETGQGSDLTPEHKIYIEDYIQNRTGNQKVSVGQQQSFSESLITDAISSAKTLSPKSLENLQKYIK